jgi:hypothetical protein
MRKVKALLIKRAEELHVPTDGDYKDYAVDMHACVLKAINQLDLQLEFPEGSIPDGNSCPRAFLAWLRS